MSGCEAAVSHCGNQPNTVKEAATKTCQQLQEALLLPSLAPHHWPPMLGWEGHQHPARARARLFHRRQVSCAGDSPAGWGGAGGTVLVLSGSSRSGVACPENLSPVPSSIKATSFSGRSCEG